MLNDGLLNEVIDIAKKYKYRFDFPKIFCTSTWKRDIGRDWRGSLSPAKRPCGRAEVKLVAIPGAQTLR